MRSIFTLWDGMVTSSAVVAIVVISFGLMIRAIDPSSALRRIGVTLGCMAILIMVPPIIAHLWGALTLWQQLGIFLLFGVMGAIALHDRGSDSPRRDRGL